MRSANYRTSDMGGIEGLPLQLMIVILVATMGTAIIVGWMGNLDTPMSIGDVDYEDCIEVDGRTIGTFVVTVTDQDGEYLEGAVVILSGMNVSSDGKTPHATTGTDGKAVFTDLTIDPVGNSKTGNITIEISKAGYTSDKTYKVLVIL